MATPEPIRSEVTYGYNCAWADFDNDGDWDILFGGYKASKGLDQDHFYLNHGDGTFSRWAGQPSSFEGQLPRARFLALFCELIDRHAPIGSLLRPTR